MTPDISTQKGKFICIEGPDGAGSSTQIELAKKYLESKERRVLVTKEPTNAMIGGLIRGVLTKDWKIDPYGLQLLFCADRAYHLAREIEPALEKGFDVVTDRYVASTLAYGAQSLQHDPEYRSFAFDYWRILMDMNGPFKIPNLTVILKLNPETCVNRIDKSRVQRELFEEQETLRRVIGGYERFAAEYPNVVLVDADGTIEETHAKIRRTLEERLEL